MMGKNSNSELPPGFATPLAKTVPRSINPPCFKSTATAVTTAATTSIPISDQSEKCNMHDQCQGETTFSVNRGRGLPRKQTPVSAEGELPLHPLPTVASLTIILLVYILFWFKVCFLSPFLVGWGCVS